MIDVATSGVSLFGACVFVSRNSRPELVGDYLFLLLFCPSSAILFYICVILFNLKKCSMGGILLFYVVLFKRKLLCYSIIHCLI